MDNSEELAKRIAKSRVEKLELPKSPKEIKSKKALIVILILTGIFILGGAGAAAYFLTRPEEPKQTEEEVAEKDPSPQVPKDDEPEAPKYYSTLSGEAISSPEENSNPTYCVQIPNGVDGARPQAGLHEAKIVFEAIAESGITRFAAIYQNPPAVVGPIRSLRIYYLDWDIPFDCTIVHAGGSADALAAVKSLRVRDLTESTTYMWRSSANYTVQRLWNNLFTSNGYLDGFNTNNGFLTSDIKAFARFTPTEASRNKIDVQATNKLKIDQPTEGDTNATAPKVTHIDIHIGAMPNFNPVYDYNPTTNTYSRSYETGAAHESYDCTGKDGEVTPELVCTEVPITPSVVIAMMVQERKADDNYHEDISTIGAGDAYIFQNGIAIQGTWEKSSREAQIIFRDSNKNEIQLVPGQTWITAVPQSYGGNVAY